MADLKMFYISCILLNQTKVSLSKALRQASTLGGHLGNTSLGQLFFM